MLAITERSYSSQDPKAYPGEFICMLLYLDQSFQHHLSYSFDYYRYYCYNSAIIACSIAATNYYFYPQRGFPYRTFIIATRSLL
jgi:hypothetical protein